MSLVACVALLRSHDRSMDPALDLHVNLASAGGDPALLRELSALELWERSVQASARLAAQEPFASHKLKLPWGHISKGGLLVCARGFGLKSDANSPRGESCYRCTRGTYAQYAGANMCTLCPAGRYSSELGRTTPCDPCPAGRTQPASGATFCHIEGHGLTHTQRRPGTHDWVVWGHDTNSKLAQEVLYSPANATACCYRQCARKYGPTLTSAGDNAGDRECAHGCRVWMRHSSLNWESPRWREPLHAKCRSDCQQAVHFGWHMWMKDAITNKGQCQSGCDAYRSCLDVTNQALLFGGPSQHF